MKTKLFLPLLFLALTQISIAQNFTLVPGTPFTGVAQSSIAFADVDGDNDQDVLITGQDLGTNYNAQLYLNERGTNPYPFNLNA